MNCEKEMIKWKNWINENRINKWINKILGKKENVTNAKG